MLFRSIKDNNIWVKDISNGEVKQLSWDGAANASYQEIHWSPDSRKIASVKKNDTKMRTIPLIESAPSNQLQPQLHWRNYYKPGDHIPVYEPALFDVITMEQISIDTKPYQEQYFLNFERWNENSDYFVFKFNKRGHQVYQVVNVNATNGQTLPVIDERSNTFIYYNRTFLKYIDGGNKAIWASERDGWNHLYLINAHTGEVLKQITKGEWVVRNIIDINENNNTIILSGNGRNKKEDPYNMHYYKVNYNTGAIEELTPQKGNHTVYFSPDKTYFLDTWSSPTTPPTTQLKSTADASVVKDFGTVNLDSLLSTGWKAPEVFVAKGRDGKTDIWGNIYFPQDYNPANKYPVVEYIYAGPHDSFVNKNFNVYDRYHKLANMGFIVVTIDGMGTANRGKEFHNVSWRNLKDSGYPDRILWIKEAARKHKAMDISNGVGVYGYSAGGQSTMAALLFFGDFYKVGVSLCGCHDNRMDKIWWNEQWLGYPIGPWYSQNSNVDNAHLLEGKLLLINGELDDNVDPTSTLHVVDALVKAGKHFEQLYLPGYGHSLGDD